MTLHNHAGGETGSTKELDTVIGTCSISATQHHSGTYSIKCNPTTTATGGFTLRQYSTTGVPASLNIATIRLSFWLYIDTDPSADAEVIFDLDDSSAGYKCYAYQDSDHKIHLYNSADAEVFVSDALPTGQWVRIGFTIGTGASAVWDVTIGSTSVGSGTSNMGANNTALVYLGKFVNSTGKSVIWYFDDIVIDDADYPNIGAIIEVMQANADGTDTKWTASAGNRWDCVDEIPADAANYIYSTKTSNDRDGVNLESASNAGISGTVNAVKVHANLYRHAASNGAARMGLLSGATYSETSANYTTTSTETMLQAYYVVDPADSGAWTLSDLDSLQLTVVERSTTYQSRCSGICATVLFTPPILVSPSGIATDEALGTPALSAVGGITIIPSGIATAEALGTPKLSIYLAPSGIATAEAHGTQKLTLYIAPSGVTSGESLGIPKFTLNIVPSGIATGEAHGNANMTLGINPDGIASAETFGTPKLTLSISPAGIASAEAEGTPGLSLSVTPSGVVSEESHGTPKLTLGISPSSILSGEVVGTPSTLPTISPSSISSAEGVGVPALSLTLFPSGVPSSDGVSNPSLTLYILPTGITSGEGAGTPGLSLSIVPSGITSGEGLGTPALTMTVKPSGIPSDEAVSDPTVTPLIIPTILPSGIASLESIGTPSFTIEIEPLGVVTGESLGTPKLTLYVTPLGIASIEAEGTPVLTEVQTIYPVSITTEEAVSNPVVTQGPAPIHIRAGEEEHGARREARFIAVTEMTDILTPFLYGGLSIEEQNNLALIMFVASLEDL
jgi:hypothetical protein